MGKLLLILRYVFLLFSSDKEEGRKHIHVTDTSSDNERLCKYWLEPTIQLAYNKGFRPKELTQIERLLIQHREILDVQIDLFLAGKRVTSIRIDHEPSTRKRKGPDNKA
jgi:hypothetical protein